MVSLLFCVDVSFAQQADVKRELKRLNAKIDRERVRSDSLETQISILLPDLRNTLRATVDAKKQTDSVAILLINRINTLQNKSKNQIIITCVLCLCFAIIDEVWQSFIPGRFSSALDVIADGIGIIIGSIFALRFNSDK